MVPVGSSGYVGARDPRGQEPCLAPDAAERSASEDHPTVQGHEEFRP